MVRKDTEYYISHYNKMGRDVGSVEKVSLKTGEVERQLSAEEAERLRNSSHFEVDATYDGEREYSVTRYIGDPVSRSPFSKNLGTIKPLEVESTRRGTLERARQVAGIVAERDPELLHLPVVAIFPAPVGK